MLTALLPASGEFPPISPILPRRQFPTNCNLCAYLFIGGDTAIICNPQCSLLSCVVILSAAVADISLIAAFLLLPPPPLPAPGPCNAIFTIWTLQCSVCNMGRAICTMQFHVYNANGTAIFILWAQYWIAHSCQVTMKLHTQLFKNLCAVCK